MAPFTVSDTAKNTVLNAVLRLIPSFQDTYWGVLFTDDDADSYHRIYVVGSKAEERWKSLAFIVLIHKDNETVHSVGSISYK